MRRTARGSISNARTMLRRPNSCAENIDAAVVSQARWVHFSGEVLCICADPQRREAMLKVLRSAFLRTRRSSRSQLCRIGHRGSAGAGAAVHRPGGSDSAERRRGKADDGHADRRAGVRDAGGKGKDCCAQARQPRLRYLRRNQGPSRGCVYDSGGRPDRLRRFILCRFPDGASRGASPCRRSASLPMRRARFRQRRSGPMEGANIARRCRRLSRRLPGAQTRKGRRQAECHRM